MDVIERAVETHFSERTPDQCVLADAAAAEREEARQRMITRRATMILNDRDYNSDLLDYVMEETDGETIVWNLRRGFPTLQDAHVAFIKKVAEAALMIAESEYPA